MSLPSTSAAALLQRIQHGLSKHSVEFVYSSHTLWPLPKTPSLPQQLRVLVLDASFNPPTLAHLALVNSPLPRFSKPDAKSVVDDGHDYDAKLLLLSVRNADKTLKPGDATYLQRLDMLQIFAQDIIQNDNFPANVAIAMVDEPTFVGKSRLLQAFFKSRFATSPHNSKDYDIQLNFIVGFDTLERLVQPRYYGSEEQMSIALRQFLSPEGDNSRVVCARRALSTSPSASGVDFAIASKFISSGRITIIDIDDDVKTYSSSEVRDTIHQLGLEADAWRKFVPQGIASYIEREGLYRSTS
ncbi:hypothetical protein H0H87_008834 [Tephrocybe sp. NHM501043]|nr:hypothetical protein H0H87_008834 [Tephrocybe sp. NHM501043]